jgi:hypothetical protein
MAAEVPNDTKLYILSYDGVVTGSQELRAYNEYHVNPQYDLYKGQLIDFFKQYDVKKKNEPFFDGFLAHMAFIDTSKPEVLHNYEITGLNYYPIKYMDDSSRPNDGALSTLKTTRINDDAILSSNFRDETEYNVGEHIFLLCPTSEIVFNTIQTILNARKITTVPLVSLFIHIQGEAINSDLMDTSKVPVPLQRDPKEVKCPVTGMTPTGGGMFGEAFNLFSGGIEIKNLRQLFINNNAEMFSVKPVCNTVNGSDGVKPVTNYNIPIYYIKSNEDILKLSHDDPRKEEYSQIVDNFIPLNVKYIFQDITDKDNLASLAIIAKLANRTTSGFSETFVKNLVDEGKHTLLTDQNFNSSVVVVAKGAAAADEGAAEKEVAEQGEGAPVESTELGQIPLYLVGFRVYESNSIPFNPDKDKEHTFRFGSTRINSVGECEKPGDNRNTTDNNTWGNTRFLKNETMDFYTLSTDGFMNVLNSVFNKISLLEGIFCKIYGGIVDGVNINSKSLRAPFNSALFTWALNTYMSLGVGANNGEQTKIWNHAETGHADKKTKFGGNRLSRRNIKLKSKTSILKNKKTRNNKKLKNKTFINSIFKHKQTRNNNRKF